ncbi:MAG: phosphoribosylanthranilate isomerase [Amaricoccus sp.]
MTFSRSWATEPASVRVKICGLRSRAEAAHAAACGATYGGLVFFPRSPRHLTLADARWVGDGMPEGLSRVALTVDADDATLDAVLDAVRIDMLQLHGRETPERVAELRQRYRVAVMKAVGVATESDLAVIGDYARVADQILIDARAPREADRPGGNGLAFDWRLIAGRRWTVPWMLAGGLTPDNIAEAIRLTGATQVDVSSGVELAPGYKDPAKVSAFVKAARVAGAENARTALDDPGVAV